MAPATDPVDADADPHIVLGLVGDPGAAFSLASELADDRVALRTRRRLPGARWCIEVVEGRLVQPPATDADLVKAARRMLLDKGWDVVICLTDLPLHVEQRPVVAHANPVRNVAIVSVPALGAMGARHRIRETIVRLLVRLIAGSAELHGGDAHGVGRPSRRVTMQRVRELGSDPADEAFFYTARVLTGNLTLISGMVAANRAVAVVAAVVARADRRGGRRSLWLGDRGYLAALRRLWVACGSPVPRWCRSARPSRP